MLFKHCWSVSPASTQSIQCWPRAPVSATSTLTSWMMMKWTTPLPTLAWRKTLWNCGTFICLHKGTRLWLLRKSAGTWSDLGWPCSRCTHSLQKVPRDLPSCSVLMLESEGVHWLIEQNSTVFGLCCWNLYVTLRIDPESWQPHFGCSQLWLLHAVVTYHGRLLEACFASVEADFDRYRKRICSQLAIFRSNHQRANKTTSRTFLI